MLRRQAGYRWFSDDRIDQGEQGDFLIENRKLDREAPQSPWLLRLD